jgi:hypothetical protein
VALSAWIVPQNVPVVLPRRQARSPTRAVRADVMSCDPTAPGLLTPVLL